MIRINVMTKRLYRYLINKRYKERHPDKVRAINKAKKRRYELRHLDRVRAANRRRNRRYRERHAGKIHERMHKWKEVNREHKRRKDREWAKANPDKVHKSSRGWKKSNKDKVNASTHKRRARKRGNGSSFTAAEWQTLKRQYRHRCVSCWKHESELKALGRKLVPDHIVPLVKGGLNHITNLQPLCHGTGGCNNRKSAKYQDFVIS
jgi:HNH endonuclease